MAKCKPECVQPEGLHFAIKPDSYHVRSYFKHATLLDLSYAEASFTGKLLSSVKHTCTYKHIYNFMRKV